MCGIWASVGLAATPAVIEAVAHRGPDGAGWRQLDTAAGPLTLGHRRLAIIDLDDRGLQPMSYGAGRCWITYNGEIYNFPELRDQLAAKGHVFATQTDTEVLLAAYAEWGEACLERLNGIFAFVLFDAERQRLFAARDRFGVKPLYLYAPPGAIALASEIKQLTALAGFEARLNRQRAFDFLLAGLFDHCSETLFAGVRQLRGGECLSLDLARFPSALPAPRRWYDLPAADSLELDFDEATERFRALLSDAVRLQLRADVAVGSCLSGGLDSSAIVCLIRQQRCAGSTLAQHSFTAAFREPEVDESRYVEAVLAGGDIVGNSVTPDPQQLFPQLERLAWHQDEPFGSTSIFAQWEVFRLAHREGMKVMLDGQGADEQLAGYHSLFGAFLGGLFLTGDCTRLLREVVALRRRHDTRLSRLAALLLVALLPRPAYHAAERLAGRHGRPTWVRRAAWQEIAPPSLPLRAPRSAGHTPLGGLCRHQTLTTSLPMLLHYEDRNSMAHSIEARVPFLDHRLVELTIGLGSRHKLANGETKTILRAAMAGVLPQSVRQRQDKLGFATPEQRWLRGPLADPVMQAIKQTGERFPELFDGARLEGFTRRAIDGQGRLDWTLWRLVSFGVWGSVFRVMA